MHHYKGFTYLAGRGATKKGHVNGEPYLVESIFDWITEKGIMAKVNDISQKSLAFLIARKIHQQGTKRSEWLNIYQPKEYSRYNIPNMMNIHDNTHLIL